MRQFLSVAPTEQDKYRVSLGASTDAVGLRGLVSPVFSAYAGNLPDLDAAEGLLFCFPASPARLLAKIQNELPRELQDRTLVGYGLACVIIAGNAQEIEGWVAELQDLLNAWEMWPLDASVLTASQIRIWERSADFVPSDDIPSEDLPYDAACQIRQLNVNLALARSRASVFAPEVVGALDTLAEAALNLSMRLTDKPGEVRTIDTVRKHHYYVARILEINAALAMVISQTLGCVPPLLVSDYPVAEYGLLGIGTSARALWSFYHHLRRCFVEADHVGRLEAVIGGQDEFDPFLNRQLLDFSQWDASPTRFVRLPKVTPRPASAHLVHYSSRFGFHETEYTLGASWQSLHASASREWHLLTVTHEFFHSQVRQYLAVIFPDTTDWARVAELLQGATLNKALESTQLAIALSMLHYRSARRASSHITPETRFLRMDGFNDESSPDQLQRAVDLESRYWQEIVVHVLDYLYTFAGDSHRYLASIWQSWSTVPSVTDRIHDYLLRSLCALASDSVMPTRDEKEVFRAVYPIALEELQLLGKDFPSPVIDAAIGYLQSVVGSGRLEIEFSQAYYIARFARVFLFDEDAAVALRRDELTTVAESTGRRYVEDPAEYPDRPVKSPLAFLSDRFAQETQNAAPELEFASLWQLILLVQPELDW